MTIMDLRNSPGRKRATVETHHVKGRQKKQKDVKRSKIAGKCDEHESSSQERKNTKIQEVGKDLYNNVPICKDIFEVVSKVGEGTFGKVYKAKLKNFPGELVALKHIIPTSDPTRVANELICLQSLGGRNNIIDIKTTIRKEDHTVFVLPFFPHDKFSSYMQKMSLEETKDYFKNLFYALKWLHSHNIIHRDIKPSNFLYSRDLKRYALVDFGLAMQVPGTSGLLSERTSSSSGSIKTRKSSSETKYSSRSQSSQPAQQSTVAFHRTDNSAHSLRSRKTSVQEVKKILCPGEHTRHEICTFCTTRSGQVAPRAGTSGFRSPEVLMKLPNQSTAVDIWATGVILLSILSGRYPFFKAPNDMTALAQIITVFGGKEVLRESLKFGKDTVCSPSPPAQDLKTLCEKLRSTFCPLHATNRRPNDANESMSDSTNKFRGTSRRRRGAYRKHIRKKAVVESDHDKILLCSFDTDSDRTFSPNSSFDELEPSCVCVPDDAYDLLRQCLRINPYERISAEDALRHPFLLPPDEARLSSIT